LLLKTGWQPCVELHFASGIRVGLWSGKAWFPPRKETMDWQCWSPFKE